MIKRNNISGFTLLEVIVSLVILTVALTAIITVGSSRAETLIELRERNRALIVANNVLEEYTVAEILTAGIYDGLQENGNTDWHWQLTVATTNNDHIYRLDVLVSKDSDFDYSSAQLVGFKWH
jgi:general secretion pathway protein I